MPKLVVDVDTVVQPFADDPMDPVLVEWRHIFLHLVRQAVMLHEGPLNELNLALEFEADESHNEIEQIIREFAKHQETLKKLTINVYLPNGYRLQLSLLQVLHQLTDLNLRRCHLVLQPNDFGNLISLSLVRVQTSPETLLHLLAKCPLLKSFTLVSS